MIYVFKAYNFEGTLPFKKVLFYTSNEFLEVNDVESVEDISARSMITYIIVNPYYKNFPVRKAYLLET